MGESFDVLIRGGDVIDGTGRPRFTADVGIQGDRIVQIGDLSGATAKSVVHAHGQIVAPGFIDAHTHDDRAMLSDGDMKPKVSQGVTTVIGGNCGVSLAPMPRPIPDPVTPPLNLLDDEGGWFRFKRFADYLGALRENPSAVNCAMLVGHSTLRVATMSNLERPADADEIAAMRDLVREAMQAGAIGVSTGLAYAPAIAATVDEIVEVCRPLSDFQGLYCSHIRDEGDKVVESLQETFCVGKELNVPVVISHHKVVGVRNHGRSKETLAIIEEAMRHQQVCLDCYPYTASSTVLTAENADNATKVTITWSKSLPQYAGRDLSEVVAEMGVSQAEAVKRLLPAGAIYHRMHEDDVTRILQFDDTMIGSDGLPHDVMPHPRLWGTFPRVLGHYGRGLGLFTLEKAVHKMTGLTAEKFGLENRGLVKEGAFADLTIFDQNTVGEGGSFSNPVVPSNGINAVLVNGSFVWLDGDVTGQRPGRVLSHSEVP